MAQAIVDLDNDGSDDEWEVVAFGTPAAPNSGADEDFDGDGILNEDERLLQTSASIANKDFALEVLSVGEFGIALKWRAPSGVIVAVEKSFDGGLSWIMGPEMEGSGSFEVLEVSNLENQVGGTALFRFVGKIQ